MILRNVEPYNRRMRGGRFSIGVFLAVGATACGGRGADSFVQLKARVVALTHVRVIDGTGRPGIDDQILIIRDGRIGAVGGSPAVAVPSGAHVVDMSGRTVIPGLVGMHEHLFYQIEGPSSGTMIVAPQAAFAKLYLAAGVTTIRTAGTADFEGDLRIKEAVDTGREPGPKIHLTGPYLNAVGADPSPGEIARQVADAANRGATSFKAYTTLRSLELRSAILAAHARGLRVTGHLCAVGFREAAALGIDNLEHGLFADTEFYSGKRVDRCPNQSDVLGELLGMNVTDAAIQQTLRELVRRGVTITSTLAVLESFTGRYFDDRTLTILSPRLQKSVRAAREPWSDPNGAGPMAWTGVLKKEMQFERAFVAAGGRLMAGVDPTGWGGVVAGFGDQRELELLVDAGFSPEAAIEIATANGAAFLREREIGTIAAGNIADLVIVRGNPSIRIADVRDVETVIKDGVGYDPAALVEATRGSVGEYQIDAGRLLVWPANAIIGSLVLLLVAKVLWRLSRARHD
jgi:imidazolonepropionase-like amidohydrolase